MTGATMKKWLALALLRDIQTPKQSPALQEQDRKAG
jgi:hypothetical protein